MVAGAKRPCGEKNFRWILHFHHTQSSLGPWKAFPLHFPPVLGAGDMTALYFAFFFLSVLKCQEPPVPISISSQHHALFLANRWFVSALWHYSVIKTWTYGPDLLSRFLLKNDTWPLAHGPLWSPPVALSSVLLLGFIMQWPHGGMVVKKGSTSLGRQWPAPGIAGDSWRALWQPEDDPSPSHVHTSVFLVRYCLVPCLVQVHVFHFHSTHFQNLCFN